MGSGHGDLFARMFLLIRVPEEGVSLFDLVWSKNSNALALRSIRGAPSCALTTTSAGDGIGDELAPNARLHYRFSRPAFTSPQRIVRIADSSKVVAELNQGVFGVVRGISVRWI